MSLNLLTMAWAKVNAEFGSYDSTYLYRILVEANKGNPVTKGFLIQCFNLVDENTSDFKKAALVNALENLAYKQEIPKFFNTNEGEDFCFVVDLEEGRDFTGYFLTIRDAEDGTLLSPNNIAGSDEDIQEVNAIDLSLTAGDFYKIHVLLENGSGTANGDAVTLLADAILVVGQSIDSA